MDIPLDNPKVINLTLLNYMPKLHSVKFTKQSKSMLYATFLLWTVRGERPRIPADRPRCGMTGPTCAKASEASVPHSDCGPAHMLQF